LSVILFEPLIYAQDNEDSLGFNKIFDIFQAQDTGIVPLNITQKVSPEELDSIFQLHKYDTTLYFKKSDYWREEFLKMILASTGEPKEESIIDSIRHVRAGRYNHYSGKVIRRIDIKQLEIFGQNILDTAQVPEKMIQKLGNGLHVHTQHKVIYNQLLFAIGDTVDPFTIADNERLLREGPYFEDAVVLLVDAGEDSTDVLIVTKDVLPIGFGIEIFDVKYGRTGMWNKNLLGLGHEFNYYLSYDFNRVPNYGHRINYRIQNIGNTFIKAEGTYENLWNIEAYRLSLNRGFFTPGVKYAGGISLEKVNESKNIPLPDTTLENARISYNLQDFWIGRSMMIRLKSSNNRRTSIAVSMRLNHYFFLNRPQVEENFLYEYHTRSTLLGSVGISSQEYLKSTLIYGFGKAEDIPFGWLLTLTGGYEISEFYNRPYLGMSYSLGKGNNGMGYLYQKLEYGTFLNEGIEQDKLNYMLNYISPLLNSKGRYNYRVFSNLIYTAGFARFDYEFLELTDPQGIRGLNSSILRGNQELIAKMEGVCYSPHKILGFRFVYFLFLDVGTITYQQKGLFSNPIYTGIGAGLRFRNERLVFSTVQLRFSYYPILPDLSTTENIQLTGISDQKFNQLTIPKPEILKYRIP
jgi:hypothetical protein